MEERCKIAELQQAGHSIHQITAALNRSPFEHLLGTEAQ
ncbi:hypothetical protein [uncultured Reyranella sp.]